LYDGDAVYKSMTLFETVNYNEWVTIDDDVEVMYTNAGHLIGSAAITLRIKEDGKTTTITFSGDVGRYRSVILKSAVRTSASRLLYP
jgi:metallo-beta-lactamase family protein